MVYTSGDGGYFNSGIPLGFIKEDNNKFEGLPYNLNTSPLDTSWLDLDPRFSEKAIDYVEDSFLSLSEEIRESCKIYLRNIEWSINHYKSSRK